MHLALRVMEAARARPAIGAAEHRAGADRVANAPELTAEQIELGRRIARKLFTRLVAAKRLDQWPSFSDHEVRALEMPGWAMRQLENNAL